MSAGSRVPAAVRKITALVDEAPGGLTIAELTAAAMTRYAGVPPERLTKLIANAVSAGLITEVEGRLVAPRTESEASSGLQPSLSGRSIRRAVALDVESVVRLTSNEPFVERHIYQVAALRFGSDHAWNSVVPRWERFLRPGCGVDEIHDAAVRRRVRDEGVDPETAWRELTAYLAEADVVVAYNGTGLDFPLVRSAVAQAGCEDPFAGRKLVDALYLAHAVWPTAASHRLHALAEAEGVHLADLRAHTAADDAELMVRLLKVAAAAVTTWTSDLMDLIASVCQDSSAWRLLLDMASGALQTDGAEAAPWDRQRVAALLTSELAHLHPKRPLDHRAASGRLPVAVTDSLRGADGLIDPAALAAIVHGHKAEPRPAQQHMAQALHEWTRQGTSGLLEAPTGTGKSYAVLAAALDWLAADTDRTAVIATYTKQLQSQMARDLKDLEKALPGILGVADLVKGQACRLSLAQLTSHLSEATRIKPVGRGRRRVVDHPGFRELAAYLLLRLRGCTEAPQSWTARSVDPVDVPAFFRDYLGRALPHWLEKLSQRDGDYQAGADTPLAAHTDSVREAIVGHRLVLANHALVLSHLDDLRALGPKALIVIDEAHELENAATSALTTTVDYQDLEDLLAESTAWLAGARDGAARGRVARSVEGLETLLDGEQLPRLVAGAFDAHAKGVGVRTGSRTAVLVSPYSGTARTQDTRRIQRLLDQVSRAVSAAATALGAYIAENSATLDVLERERITGLSRRADDTVSDLGRLVAEIDVLLNSAVALEGPRSETAPSRVVYLEELAEPRGGLRAYRFRFASSPIDLPLESEWQRYLESFARVHYISATLRVSGDWTFLRNRLGLPETMPALALPSPFNLARQAELVCFSDFPSWAEQEEGAMRTIAHQLAGYAQEMVHARPDGNGHDGGGMVLTTARATAAGISGHLERELRTRGLIAPVTDALVLGNGRAVAEFTGKDGGGGFLVGTKGLWQGVDVSDEQRLRLVWINKLPFAPFAAPVVEARRASVRERAVEAGHPDPDGAATETYYLPLAALQLRQAVGRLIRSDRHRGVVIISDRKLGGQTGLRRSYRRAFLGSLDEGLLRPDPVSGETGGGNVGTMADGWRRIWHFMAGEGLLPKDRVAALCTDEALEAHTLLPHTRRIRELALTRDAVERLRAEGRLTETVLDHAAKIAGLLGLSDEPVELKPAQLKVIAAVTEGRNVLGLLPTGFGKSYTFQLPALVLPGVTIVVSPLVALMHDQALELNRTIGGAVRALISPLRESSSRAGKTEVADQLLGRADHGIRLVYVSPERLCQRRFRELVHKAVAAGQVNRIAVDEAHTVAQWEDFRPSMRRVGRFLAELRHAYGLPVTAVTATANRAVHAALRESLFGISADPPAVGSVQEVAEAVQSDVRSGLVTVRENPIRPELAVFRRSLNQPGPRGVAGLAEQVLDALDGHAIFYCLTVKEVNALHAHLREYVGDTGVRVLRFHGRITEAEKSAVMNEFRDAPHQGEEGFVPLVVVATSAFGLGINRSDVRTVFCVSPPTDLAALYQQIGRAGRDSTGETIDGERPVNAGLALATSRGLRMVKFMTSQELPTSLLRRMGNAVLAQRGSLDPAALAEELMATDAAAGLLDEAELRDGHTAEQYRSGVMRAFSTLADLGAVTDQGDYPPLCAIRPGEIKSGADQARSVEEADLLERHVVETVLTQVDSSRVSVDTVHAHLVARVSGYKDYSEGPAGTWEILADLHDRGLLDVSAAPSRRLVTGLAVHTQKVPETYLPLLTRRGRQAADELALLRDFFDDNTTCAQRKFADYFGEPQLPKGCCANAQCRCSACWATPDWPLDQRRPAIARAFEGMAPRAAAGVDSALRDQRLDRQVYRLAQLRPGGVRLPMLWQALRGEESSYNVTQQKSVLLPRSVRDSPHFGGHMGLSRGDVERSIDRLVAAGALAPVSDGVWQARRGALSTESAAGAKKANGR